MHSRWIFTVDNERIFAVIMNSDRNSERGSSSLSFATDNHGRTQDSGFWIKGTLVVLKETLVVLRAFVL